LEKQQTPPAQASGAQERSQLLDEQLRPPLHERSPVHSTLTAAPEAFTPEEQLDRPWQAMVQLELEQLATSWHEFSPLHVMVVVPALPPTLPAHESGPPQMMVQV
jgi:hypothetical protein